MHTTPTTLMWPLLGLALLACDIDEPLTFPCDETATLAQVAGAWTLTGTAERNDCDPDELNGANIKLNSTMPLTITQADTMISMDSVTIGDSKLVLQRGSVEGDCVEFETLETSPDGTISYEFVGRFVEEPGGARVIEGVLKGDGPGSCTADGSFEISID